MLRFLEPESILNGIENAFPNTRKTSFLGCHQHNAEHDGGFSTIGTISDSIARTSADAGLTGSGFSTSSGSTHGISHGGRGHSKHHFTSFSESPTFMIVSGISAKKEQCLIADVPDKEGSGLHLGSCEGAVRKGNGAELFRFMDNGSLYTLMGKKCMALVDGNVKNGGSVELVDCDKAAAAGDQRANWEPMPSSQLKLGRAGDYCLTMAPEDAKPGEVDLIKGNATFDVSSRKDPHAEGMVGDGQDSTYWASDFDPDSDVTFSVDLQKPSKISQLKIDWEYPPKSFVIESSMDGVHWTGCAGSSNNEKWTYIMQGKNIEARHVRIVMKEYHPTLGKFGSHYLYGIQHLKVTAQGLYPAVEKCAATAMSPDARDKWFLVEVTEFNPCSNPSLDITPQNMKPTEMFQNDVPDLEAKQPTGLPSNSMLKQSALTA